MVNGSATLTVTSGSVPASNIDAIDITGTSGGNPLTVQLMVAGSGSSVGLSALWPGDTGNVTWMAVNTQNGAVNMISFATGNADTSDLMSNYACVWNNATSLTLDHPWKGSTGSNYYGWIGNLAGWGQQPFYQGINAYRMGQLAAATAPALAAVAATYQSYNNNAIAWIKNTGFDMATLTTNYGREFQFCEPFTVSSTIPFDWRQPGCTYTTANPDSMTVGREQNMEISNAFSDYYIYNPSSANLAWGDQAYGAVWGNGSFNTGGVYFDGSSDATNQAPTNLSDSNINGGKWYGFFAGMGMLHRWPAVRLGGVDPPNNATVGYPFHAGRSDRRDAGTDNHHVTQRKSGDHGVPRLALLDIRGQTFRFRPDGTGLSQFIGCGGVARRQCPPLRTEMRSSRRSEGCTPFASAGIDPNLPDNACR